VALDAAEAGILHLRCGQCRALLGAFDSARDHLEATLRIARGRADADLEQMALYELAGLYASRDYHRAEELAQEQP
jgi:hypothetical protein